MMKVMGMKQHTRKWTRLSATMCQKHDVDKVSTKRQGTELSKGRGAPGNNFMNHNCYVIRNCMPIL